MSTLTFDFFGLPGTILDSVFTSAYAPIGNPVISLIILFAAGLFFIRFCSTSEIFEEDRRAGDGSLS